MLNLIDKTIIKFDQCLKTIWGHPEGTGRPDPAEHLIEETLDQKNKNISASLMRINHSGEICAQALYLGQAFGTHNTELKRMFLEAATEENDHLIWCKNRVEILNSHTSYFNPLWYAGSFILGAFASRCGDGWSLGFLEETEKQVIQHLEGHLSKFPINDNISPAYVKQMIQDEAKHARTAAQLGARPLPKSIRIAMKYTAKIMTTMAYYG